MEVDTGVVVEDVDMENDKEEKQEDKETKSVKLPIWRTSKSHGYNGLSLMYHPNHY
jgi:hypothetical protein